LSSFTVGNEGKVEVDDGSAMDVDIQIRFQYGDLNGSPTQYTTNWFRLDVGCNTVDANTLSDIAAFTAGGDD
jgi:hypothetical protein